MSTLDLEQPLRRAPELTVVLRGRETIVRDGVAELSAGPHALALLDAFATPRSPREVIASIPVRGARDFLELNAALFRLCEAGFLVATSDASRSPRTRTGFDAPPIHVRMLRDRRRTSAFRTAILESVRPDDIVLDLGTGTGVLAIFAARSGAAHVYAVESGAIAEVARKTIEANGLGERITVLEGRSTRISLPEPCSLLICELIGDEPLGEGLLEAIRDARNRLLTPDARILPKALRILGELVELPREITDDHFFTDSNLASFRFEYGVDFGPFARSGGAPFFTKLDTASARAADRLSEPFVLAEIDLSDPPLRIDNTAEALCIREGTFDAVLVHVEALLSESTRLLTHPDVVDEHHHWQYPCWLVGQQRRVSPGKLVTARYRYDERGARLELGP